MVEERFLEYALSRSTALGDIESSGEEDLQRSRSAAGQIERVKIFDGPKGVFSNTVRQKSPRLNICGA